MDRLTSTGVSSVFVEGPLALGAFVSFLVAPDVAKPVLGCFAGALFVWWQSDKKRWDRRLGYAFVSLVLGGVFGYAAMPLVAFFWADFPPEFAPAIYCFPRSPRSTSRASSARCGAPGRTILKKRRS